MALPEGLEVSDRNLVCLLGRSIYGLKQSARMWYERFHIKWLQIGLVSSTADSNIYILHRDNGYLILALYVDDTILAATSMALINHVKTLLSQEFKMTDLSDAYHVLGMHIQRDRKSGWLRLNQSTYISTKLKHFFMDNCNPVSTPYPFGLQLSTAQAPISPEDQAYMAIVPYPHATGSLMWAMICSRPDIAYSVSTVAQFMSNPGVAHWTQVKRIFRYLAGTKDFCLQYSQTSAPFHLQGFSDASYGDNVDSHKSTSGFCFLLAGRAVSWSSRKQKSVALSSTESEYMALTKACTEAIWLRRLLFDMGQPQKITEIYCDNKSAITIVHSSKHHDRTKHIDIRFHYIKDQVSSGEINIVYVPTEDMTADIMTKGLYKGLHAKHTSSLGLQLKWQLSGSVRNLELG